MLATYDFRCSRGHVFECLVEKGVETVVCVRCGRRAKRIFTICTNTIVPDHMKAPGSKRSTAAFHEKNREWLRKGGNRKFREQDDRIAARGEAAQKSFNAHLRDNQWRLDELKKTRVSAGPIKRRKKAA